MKHFAKFLKDESGATAIEYALIAGLLGIGIVAGATNLKTALDTKFKAVGTSVGNAQ